jgi:hypothetical protein
MKNLLFLLSATLLFSCGETEKTSSENTLDDLLLIKNEAELKDKFGADHISWDTVWGGEGEFTFGTYIDKGQKDEVQILWDDDATRSTVISVSVNAMHIQNPTEVFSSKWQTSTGIKLGMTTDELEKLNGKSFVFSGGVMDWREGKLDKAGIGIQLMEGPEAAQLPEEDYMQVIGDIEVMSDNAVIKKLQPRVTVMTVFKPE